MPKRKQAKKEPATLRARGLMLWMYDHGDAKHTLEQRAEALAALQSVVSRKCTGVNAEEVLRIVGDEYGPQAEGIASPSDSEREAWERHLKANRRVVVRADVYSKKPTLRWAAKQVPAVSGPDVWRDAAREARRIAEVIAGACRPAMPIRLSSRAGLPAYEVVDGEEVAAVVRFCRA